MKKSEERHRTVIKNSDIMKPTSSSHFYTSEETAKILDGKAVLKDMINDIDKTKLARPANIAHKLDSDIVTQVVKELKVYAIHDNFIGNDVEIMKLFDMMNKHYESTDDYSLYVVK
jgi:hypothetical protein